MTRFVLAAAIVTALVGPEQMPGAPPPSPPAAAAASVAWMAGHWTGTAGPLQMEEIWTAADGGALVGLHKDVAAKNGAPRMVSFEFLRIETDGGSLVYIAQPGGRPPTRFPLAEIAARRAVFANPAHDFPQRIIYWLDDSGALHARVEGTRNGTTAGEEWSWTRRP
jgi:hypothetical protein